MKHLIIFICTMLSLTMGCTNLGDTTADRKTQEAWKQFDEAYRAKDLNHALVIIDSMEQAHIIGTAKADYLRGLAYDQGWQMRIAEHYYKKAHESYRADHSNSWYDYTDTGYRWACLCFGRGDIEGAVDIISRLLAQAEGNKDFPKNVHAALLVLMADCQMKLHQYEACRQSCYKSYEIQLGITDDGVNSRSNLTTDCMDILDMFFNMGDTDEAQQWLERSAEALALYEQADGDSLLIEEWKGLIALKRARLYLATGHAAEAAATYAAVPRSRLVNPLGYTEAANYLMAAGRYDEAAYWYEQLDSTYLATDGAQMTFDNIASRLAPRYSAYRKAGRNSDALAIADSIRTAIDSAIVWQKKDAAAELAVIYQTHEKDLQLTDLRFSVDLHRLLLITGGIILLLIVWLLWRSYIYNKVLLEKNRRLLAEIEQREHEEQQERASLLARNDLSANQQLFRRICDLMDSSEHIYTDSDLDRNRLAQLLSTNEHYVTDAIRACANGKSVNGFLNEYRLRYAAHLLATTKDPVALIAELSGFSRSSFFRIFSDAYGMSPSDYRKVAGK